MHLEFGAYVIFVILKSTLCTEAMTCATVGGATARSLYNRSYVVFRRLTQQTIILVPEVTRECTAARMRTTESSLAKLETISKVISCVPLACAHS